MLDLYSFPVKVMLVLMWQHISEYYAKMPYFNCKFFGADLLLVCVYTALRGPDPQFILLGATIMQINNNNLGSKRVRCIVPGIIILHIKIRPCELNSAELQ